MSIVLRNHAEPSRQSARRIGRGLAQRASMLWRKGHYWRRSAPRARNDADHTLLPVAALPAAKVRGYGQMISAVECREHAVECRQMSEHAPSLRVRDILIDMARSWERLALETEHSAPTSPKLLLRHQFRREL
jgi:hypothetical protein